MSTPTNTTDIKPVYYFYGADTFLLEEAIEKIKSRLLTGGFKSMNYETFNSANLKPEAVVMAAETLPAFAERRVIVVKGFGKLKDVERKKFMPYLENPSPSTCLILISDEEYINLKKATVFTKFMNKKGYLREFKALSAGALNKWVVDYVKKAGKNISMAVVEMLVALIGGKLKDIKGELDKLTLFVGTNDAITEADVEMCVTGVSDDNAFDLAGAIGVKDTGSALKVLLNIKGEEPLKVLGALTWQFRLLVKVKDAVDGGARRPFDIAKAAKISPYNIERHVSLCRNFSTGELMDVMVRLGELDKSLKSSRLPGDMQMTSLVLDLCKKRQVRRAG
ncbi:MAG: DNA polymerase III subunit delta [Deltaproteobacteria bacterium]|nr:DNA polymerase III subunit delta [Deltaproteobacteria bacterium]